MAQTFTPSNSKKKPKVSTIPKTEADPLKILWRAFSYLKPYARIAISAYASAIIINIFAVIIPQVIRRIIDVGIVNGQTQILAGAVAVLLVLTALKGVFGFLLGRWSEVASQYVAYDLRNAIHEKLHSLSFAYHDRAETGQLLSRSIQDVERIRFLSGRAILRMFQAMTLLLITFVALVWMNWRLAILAVMTMPLLSYVAFRFGRIYRPLSRDIQNELGNLTTALEQNLRGARIVKAFAQEDAEIKRFEQANQHWFDLSAIGIKLSAINVPFINFIASMSTVIIIWYGGQQVMSGNLTLGELVAFTTYLGQLVNPLRRFGVIIPAVAQAAASGERIFEILDAESDVREAPDAIELPQIEGNVQFDNVSFAYFGKRTVLSEINLDVKAGEVIALLGTTGSGKSTVMNLIPRFYDPSSGTITIDGVDIRSVTLNSLRDQIGIVLQETTLFASTLRENIAFGSPNATDEDVIAAAQAAQAHDFITKTKDGYDTEVGERGITLSGGQKQRVAIARALLKNPRVLLLDDATSSVDTETERDIQIALENLMQGRTSFVIAQRLSTVRMADRVLVLDKGRIMAQGTHDELIERSGLYAEIYHRNLR